MAQQTRLERMARWKRAYDLRQSGLKWREVGAILNVGSDRASWLAHLYEYYRERRQVKDCPMNELTCRIINGLAKKDFNGEFTPKDIAQLTKRDLLDIPNLGKKSIKEIEDWLSRHGYSLRSEPPKFTSRDRNWIDTYEEYHSND